MKRRDLLAAAAGVLGPLSVRGSATTQSSGSRIQSTFELFGPDPRAGGALYGDHQITSYAPFGDAASANTQVFHFNQGLAPVWLARWVCIWNPIDGIGAGVRLIDCDLGFTNINQMADFVYTSGPVPNGPWHRPS